MIADGLIFIDEKNGKKLIFNYFTFCEIIKGCIVKYGYKTYEEAADLVNHSHIIRYPCTDYLDAALLSHDYDYHWAMLLALGDSYWRDNPSLSNLPDGYLEWRASFIKEHNLKEDPFDFLD